MELGHIFEKIALGVEAAAVAVIVVGIIIGTILYIYRLLRKHNATETFGDYRHGLARTFLLSLEFLVAVGVLGLVILVRTFLGWALEVELTGRWPWQKWRYSTAPGDGQEG